VNIVISLDKIMIDHKLNHQQIINDGYFDV
jgi:hypothetical protein